MRPGDAADRRRGVDGLWDDARPAARGGHRPPPHRPRPRRAPRGRIDRLRRPVVGVGRRDAVRRRQDEAQAFGPAPRRGRRGAGRRRGADALSATTACSQSLPLPAGGGAADRCARRARAANIELDDVRSRIRVALGAARPAADQVAPGHRRVAAQPGACWPSPRYALIGAFSDIDLASFLDALRDASWWWLAFALVLAQIARVPAAVSTMGSIDQPLPLGPLTALQFAICYVNLAIPSTAARVAINVRFLQRFGVPPATAMTAGVIDSVSGFVVQISLFVLAVLHVRRRPRPLAPTRATSAASATIALIALAVLVVAVVVVALIGPVRRRVVDDRPPGQRRAAGAALAGQAAAAVRRQRAVSQVLFAVAFAACRRGVPRAPCR